jgi:transcriptional regulator with XRE-family HTH domain
MVLLRHLLGDALRRLRLRQGRTLREVSASARVSLGYLSEVERGQKEASSELLGSICSALDTPLSQVLREVSDNFALAELQNEPVLTGAREPGPSVGGPDAPPAGPAKAAGPADAKVRLGASAGGRQLVVRDRPAMAGRVPGRTIPSPAPGRIPARVGRSLGVQPGQHLGTPSGQVIDTVSLQGGAAGPAGAVMPGGATLSGGAAFDQLTWRAPDITDMVPV